MSLANSLLAKVRAQLTAMSQGNQKLLGALRRKLYKELMYDEPRKPMPRRALKTKKRNEQGGYARFVNNFFLLAAQFLIDLRRCAVIPKKILACCVLPAISRYKNDSGINKLSHLGKKWVGVDFQFTERPGAAQGRVDIAPEPGFDE